MPAFMPWISSVQVRSIACGVARQPWPPCRSSGGCLIAGSRCGLPCFRFAQVQPDQPELSRWTLEYAAFGQSLRFSWLARNLQVPPPSPQPLCRCWLLLRDLPCSALMRAPRAALSWRRPNLVRRQPIHHQKIHWRSVDGLPNRGAVRFYPRGPSACEVEVRPCIGGVFY
eukprot:SM000141S00926  [mRNA]  locus=s141:265228:265933:- [translate_table: standard]